VSAAGIQIQRTGNRPNDIGTNVADTISDMMLFETREPVRLVVEGEIDITSGDSLKGTGIRLAEELAPNPLDVDLSAVSFIDSSGISALIAIRNAAREAGGSLVISKASPAVLRLFELSGLRESFEIDRPD
jgi:anti-anti-sigma factor